MQTLTDLSRLSLNQATTQYWSLKEAADGCARAGIPAIGIWRHKLAEVGNQLGAKIVRDAGLKVSGLCRGGMFPAATHEERLARIEDNKRAIEEAATLEADTLVLVCGPAPDRDIWAARQMVADGIEAMLPLAQEMGVKIGIEPLHPMYAGDRSVITSLGEALDLVDYFKSPHVGVVIDVYHVWWDSKVFEQIERAKDHIFSFHVCDWLVPTPHMLNGRGMMGDGVIDIRSLRAAVEATGYNGLIEVEIFNESLWNTPYDSVLDTMAARYLSCV